MDILRVFLIPDYERKDNKSKENQINEYKEEVHEKNVIVRNHLAKIEELEIELAELKLKQAKMDYAIRAPNLDESELSKIILSYDNVVQKLLEERQTLIIEKAHLEDHIINLERHFQLLLEQYEKSKGVMKEVMNKEIHCNEKFDSLKRILQLLKEEHKLLVKHSHSKLDEMKLEIHQDKKYIQQLLNSKYNNKESVQELNRLVE